jgi:hypothetical protein
MTSNSKEALERLTALSTAGAASLRPYLDHNGFEQHEKLQSDLRIVIAERRKLALEADHQRKCAVAWFDKFQGAEAKLAGDVSGLVEACNLLNQVGNIGWPTAPAESSAIRQSIRDFLELHAPAAAQPYVEGPTNG